MDTIMSANRWEKKDNDSDEIYGWVKIHQHDSVYYIRITSINNVVCDANGHWHMYIDGDDMNITIEQAAQIMSRP